jgi:branched-chain amino acid transport system permease protein
MACAASPSFRWGCSGGQSPSRLPWPSTTSRSRGRRWPWPRSSAAIRENGDRATACGYDVNRARLLSFVFSALITGLAGALDALRLNVVPVEAMFWSTSGQVVIMTLLGGAGTFFGPFVGAATFLVLGDRLSVVLVDSWPLVIGAVFMVFVLFLPKGIWGTLIGGFHGR